MSVPILTLSRDAPYPPHLELCRNRVVFATYEELYPQQMEEGYPFDDFCQPDPADIGSMPYSGQDEAGMLAGGGRSCRAR